MLADGDFAEMDIFLDYYLRQVPFLRARAQALRPNASLFPDMISQTETATVFGSFSEVDWVGDGDCGAKRPADLPLYLQNNPYIYLDNFGDGPLGELGLMILDRFLYDQNASALAGRLPWINGALEFADYSFLHGGDEMVIFPTQACETYWSPWPINCTTECVVNDAPTVAVLTRLLERSLAEIPAALVQPPARRARWAAMLARMPPLPTAAGGLLAPAQQYASKLHNSESVAMYSTHPARTFSVGRSLTAGVDLAPAIATFKADPNAGGSAAGNDGWHQGTMHAPLLGLRNETAQLLLARTHGKPLPGFRFPFFSAEAGMADEAAAEAFSNLAAGAQFALLQPGDDAQASIVLLPGWPCQWDVHFKLHAPLQTVVEGVWAGGALASLTVTPPERAAAVILAPGC